MAKIDKVYKTLQSKYDELLKKKRQIEDDFRTELVESEEKNRLYRDFLVRLAQKTGSTQNMEDVEARVKVLVIESDKLRSIKDNRPLMPHPFQGIGDKINKILDYIIKKLYGKTKKK